MKARKSSHSVQRGGEKASKRRRICGSASIACLASPVPTATMEIRKSLVRDLMRFEDKRCSRAPGDAGEHLLHLLDDQHLLH